MAKCRSCHQEITWAITTGGSFIPLDAMPVEDGNVQIGADGRANVLPRDAVPAPQYARYRSHFVTCPYADKHRHLRRVK